MPNEGKSVEQLMEEFNRIYAHLNHEGLVEQAGEQEYEWLRSALSAVVLGAVEKAKPVRLKHAQESKYMQIGYDKELEDYRQSLISLAQEIAKDV